MGKAEALFFREVLAGLRLTVVSLLFNGERRLPCEVYYTTD
jgi:hypothetical protein